MYFLNLWIIIIIIFIIRLKTQNKHKHTRKQRQAAREAQTPGAILACVLLKAGGATLKTKMCNIKLLR